MSTHSGLYNIDARKVKKHFFFDKNTKRSIFKSVVVVSLLNIIEFFATMYELALCFVELAEAEIPSRNI